MSKPVFTLYINAYGGWDWTRTTGQGTRVTFTDDTLAAAYIARKQHLVLDADPATDWDTFPKAFSALFPLCEHQMSLSNCYGPDHYMSAEQERALEI